MSKRYPKEQPEIDQEIKKLEEAKSYVPRFSKFGDDNHAGIEAGIETLKEGYGHDEILQKFDDGDWGDSQRDGAESAMNWRDEGEESPSEGWEIFKE